MKPMNRTTTVMAYSTVRVQPKLTFQLRSELRVLAMQKAPEIPTGPHCTDPNRCEFFDQCNDFQRNRSSACAMKAFFARLRMLDYEP